MWQNELREIEWQVFVDGMVKDLKQLLENSHAQAASAAVSEWG